MNELKRMCSRLVIKDRDGRVLTSEECVVEMELCGAYGLMEEGR